MAVAVVAGCGGREQSVRPATASSVPPVPAGARPCHALRYKGTQGANSVTDVYWLAVKNTSSKTCALDGRPAIVVLPGAPAPLSVIATPLDPSVPLGFPHRGARFGLRPGRSAQVTLWVVRPCDHDRRLSVRQRLRAFLPIGDAQTTFTILTCKGEGSVLSVGVFAPA